eukprot:TRINITY_DN3385_c0_g1_i2.p1 TRINITY_DN3385_c0_g1~~TRINITY_DN3385_c0_g1_i2.p1  ORF type:complete len:336 (+),score=97.06 TRINITY_DN3385_c0_g1_i2:178-1185(+)
MSTGKLCAAARSGDNHTLRRLVASQTFDPQATDLDNWTPLHHAAAGGQLGALKLLLDKRAQVDQRDALGETALHKAAWAGEEAVMRQLAQAGASVDCADENRWTCLHKCAHANHAKGVDVLLEHGAGIEPLDDTGMSPLYRAVLNGAEHAVTRLLQARACMDHRDSEGRALLELARGRAAGVLRAMEEEMQHRTPEAAVVAPVESRMKTSNLALQELLDQCRAYVEAGRLLEAFLLGLPEEDDPSEVGEFVADLEMMQDPRERARCRRLFGILSFGVGVRQIDGDPDEHQLYWYKDCEDEDEPDKERTIRFVWQAGKWCFGAPLLWRNKKMQDYQ